jgi:hypothetical protein
VLPLVVLGGEHFERQRMARLLRAGLSPTTLSRIDSLPLLWIKELHWTYESHPMRFVASQADTPRIIASCEPSLVPRMIHALHGNWKEDCRGSKLLGWAAWKEFPFAEAAGVLRQGADNLFHTGQIERLLEPTPEPLVYEHGLRELAPFNTKRVWWPERVKPDEEATAMSRYKPRAWFEDIVNDAPSGWPQRRGFELVLAMAPGINKFVPDYAAKLDQLGSIEGRRLILASRDSALRKALDEPQLWQDHIHLENGGAIVFSNWLAGRAHPIIETLKQAQH